MTVVLAASAYTITRAAGDVSREPAWIGNHLVPDSVAPGRGADVRLLWLSGRTASPTPRGTVVLDEAGSIVEFDRRLRPVRRPLAVGLRDLDGVAAAPAGGLWVADARGLILRVDSAGQVVSPERRTRFAHTMVASDAAGAFTWVARSTRRFGYDWAAAGGPVLLRLDSAGREAQSVAGASLPAHVMLQDLANAVHVAVGATGRVYVAPFIRDEIVALSPSGDTLWVVTRDLPQSTREPRFELRDGRAVIDYHPVNLGVAVGPDSNLYVLSTPGFTTERSRLDVLDAATGALLRTAELSTAQPTLAVDHDGRVYLLDATRLLTGIAEAKRPAFPRVSLETLRGDTFTVARERGRVLLVNVWASWCAPCREEMPALDSLSRAIADTTFRFVTINVDATRGDAAMFMEDFGFTFPVALAGSDAAGTIQYVGLPYTVLVDREGRVAQKWAGYSGARQVADVAAAVRRELSRGPAVTHAHH